jgi:hypothetical protein
MRVSGIVMVIGSTVNVLWADSAVSRLISTLTVAVGGWLVGTAVQLSKQARQADAGRPLPPVTAESG